MAWCILNSPSNMPNSCCLHFTGFKQLKVLIKYLIILRSWIIRILTVFALHSKPNCIFACKLLIKTPKCAICIIISGFNLTTMASQCSYCAVLVQWIIYKRMMTYQSEKSRNINITNDFTYLVWWLHLLNPWSTYCVCAACSVIACLWHSAQTTHTFHVT